MPVLHGQHIFFAREFRFTVNANRFCFILFGVRFAFLTIENVIGAEVNQLRVPVVANLGKETRRLCIDAESLFAACFAKINIGKRRRIDQSIKIRPAKLLANVIEIR